MPTTMLGINRMQDSVDVVAGFLHASCQRPRWATAADRDSGAPEAAMNCCPPWTGKAGWRSARPGLFTGIVDLKLSRQSSILSINLLLRGGSTKSGLMQTDTTSRLGHRRRKRFAQSTTSETAAHASSES